MTVLADDVLIEKIERPFLFLIIDGLLGEGGWAEREVRRSAVIDCRGLQPQMHVKSQLDRGRRREQGFDGTLRRRRQAGRERRRRCKEVRGGEGETRILG